MADSFRAKEKEICRMLNTGLLACAGVFGGGRFFGIVGLSWAHILVIVLVLAVMAVLEKPSVRVRLLSLAVTAAFLCMGAAAAGWEVSIAFLRSYFSWLVGSAQIPQEWRFAYELLQTGLVAVLCCPLELLIEKVRLFQILAVAAACAFLFFCLFCRVELTGAGVAFLLLFLVTMYVRWTQERWKKVRGAPGRSYMLWIAPFLACYLLILAAIPMPEKPYEWFWAKNIYRQLREVFYVWTKDFRWGSGEGFGMAFSGFSEEGELHGELLTDAREVMLLQSDGNLTSNLYLAGKEYDTFDGREWTKEDVRDLAGYYLDAVQTLCAVREYDREYQKDYLKEVRLEVSYEDFRTGFVFAPLKTWMIEMEKGDEDYTWQDGTAAFSEYRGFGTRYRVRYYQLNMGSEEFDAFLESGAARGEAAWQTILKTYGTESGNVTEEEVAAYRRSIYENYLDDVILSEDVERCLSQMTEGARTDLEKLRAVEKALHSYTYTQTPGQLPEKVEDAGSFLDYFLLESRQGYCTYFATAFVLLARAEGIPARYVQGYCVPALGEKEAAVYSNMAHAWPEAYLEGVGWIPFEPTPGYEDLRYTSWGLTRQRKQEEATSATEEPAMEEIEKGDAAEAVEEEPEDSRRLPWFVIPSFLAVCLVLFGLDSLFGRYRYLRMSMEEKYHREVAKDLRLLSVLGLSREEGETLWELSQRAAFERGMSLGFVEDYEKVLYGGAPVSQEMIQEATAERELLLEQVKTEKKWVYVGCRLWLRWSRYR